VEKKSKIKLKLNGYFSNELMMMPSKVLKKNWMKNKMKKKSEVLELEKILEKLEDFHLSFEYLKIKIASPERIKSWAQRVLPHGEIVGEVLRSETINFRTHQPESYGLFCEKIFGPLKNWKCKCGRYNGFVLDKICEACNVEIIEARVRRYRMGYIDLSYPITHFWYLKGNPNYLTTILTLVEPRIKTSNVESLIYFRNDFAWLVAQPPHPALPLARFEKEESIPFKDGFFIKKQEKQTNGKEDITKSSKNELKNFLKIGTKFSQKREGAELIKAALESIDLKLEITKKRSQLEQNTQAKFLHDNDLKLYIRQIRILESFFATKTNLSWMIFTVLPVLPPSLRPLLELENGRLVAADLNEIYRLILIRNQRLFDFRSFFVPDLIITQGRKLLQECVDSLIDNARVSKQKQITLNNKALKSLTEILEGKQGRFRQSLLGKRVDYSGRSVIVVGPSLRLNQCGIPYQIGIELFQPFLINELLKIKMEAPSYNIKLANNIIKKNKPFVWTLLAQLTQKYSVLLNRAPTLHRFGIQAFDPVLVLGQAIHLHPLVCTGFNADFDGDQMAIHLPLYEASQLEIRTMMRPSYNVLSPANGEVILKPTQDMVIGCYYLTLMITKNKQNFQKWFGNEQDALRAFYQKKINIHTPILVRYKIFNLDFEIENKKLTFIDSEKTILFKQKEVNILKVFKINPIIEKFYLITDIGILIAYSTGEQVKKYSLTDLFMETSPGRLIFSNNFKLGI
jgi:DNA-directed RNA polymerase subunit beta'